MTRFEKHFEALHDAKPVKKKTWPPGWWILPAFGLSVFGWVVVIAAVFV